MQYVRLGEFLAVARITGPTHNLLQIRLATFDEEPLVCERLQASGGCRHTPLNEEALVQSVLEGASETNERLGTSYVVSHIRYVENDTPPESVYGHLAGCILEHLHAGGEFQPGISASPNNSFKPSPQQGGA